MKIFILFFLFFIFLLVVPIIIKTKINFDFLRNVGEVNFYLFGIRILYRKWKIGINKIILIAKNNKEKHMILFDLNNKSGFGDYFIREFIKLININTIKIFSKIGIENYAMYTAILNSSINFPLQVVLGKIYERKKPGKIVAKIMPDFYNSSFFVGISSSINFSIVEILWALIVSYFIFKTKKRKLYYGGD